MDKRRVSNREELIEAISTQGFETYSPESLSFPEQVALFDNAEVLIGPTGSSFANMIFATEADVVELFSPNRSGSFYTFYAELSQAIGHNYVPMFGDEFDEESSDDPHNQDFSVSPDRVRSILADLS
jgi:capsular polysaccharide biosynthesis protein